MISRRDLIHLGEGFLMGAADIIPGVSGGTVALILGIYNRLVTAISHFDLTLLKHLRRREWGAAVKHIDLVFLVLLVSGILLGILLLATTMHWLLQNEMQHTFAAFFGMIMASCYVVSRMIPRWDWAIVLLMLLGALGASWIVGLPFLENPPIGPFYIFFSAVIAICAMILPGISGAFILLILGAYAPITGTLRALLKGQVSDETWYLLIFVVGAATGLIGFSKFLKWLLANYEAATMAVLFGFMVGSLRKIWPYKNLVEDAAKFEERIFQNRLPDFGQTDDGLSLVILVVAGGLVLLLEYIASHRQPSPATPAHNPAQP